MKLLSKRRMIDFRTMSLFNIGLLIYSSCSKEQQVDENENMSNPMASFDIEFVDNLTITLKNHSLHTDKYEWEFGDYEGEITEVNPTYI